MSWQIGPDQVRPSLLSSGEVLVATWDDGDRLIRATTKSAWDSRRKEGEDQWSSWIETGQVIRYRYLQAAGQMEISVYVHQPKVDGTVSIFRIHGDEHSRSIVLPRILHFLGEEVIGWEHFLEGRSTPRHYTRGLCPMDASPLALFFAHRDVRDLRSPPWTERSDIGAFVQPFGSLIKEVSLSWTGWQITLEPYPWAPSFVLGYEPFPVGHLVVDPSWRDLETKPRWLLSSQGEGRVIGFGDTPLEALSSVPFFVWPQDSAIGQILEEWKEDSLPCPYRLTFDPEIYTLLGVNVFLLPPDDFRETVEGLQEAL